MKKLIAVIALGLSAGIPAVALPEPWDETGWEEPQESVVKRRDGGPRRNTAALAPQDALPYLFWVE